MLQVLSGHGGLPAYIRQVALGFHPQNSAEIAHAIVTRIPRFGLSEVPKPIIKLGEPFSQLIHFFQGDAPLFNRCSCFHRFAIPLIYATFSPFRLM